MSDVFFDELQIPEPSLNLGVGSASHGRQTAEMLTGIEEVLIAEKPDYVLVYGDTNSTLAGALAACKLGMRIAHVEAGLRSYNRAMPEEHNRVLTDHIADTLFCPVPTAAENLAREGILKGVHIVGDTMYDAVRQYREVAARRSAVLTKLNLQPKKYLLATVHRAYNTDIPETLRSILQSFAEIDEPVIFPVHPRTKKKIGELGFEGILKGSQVVTVEPLGYFDMLHLHQNARLLLTDSGGMQKEAFFLGVPCVTLRPETEWGDTVRCGWNVLAGNAPVSILNAVRKGDWPTTPPPEIFGNGDAAEQITMVLEES
jgi:UDP-N-acetylglucosamine 2-epimerase